MLCYKFIKKYLLFIILGVSLGSESFCSKNVPKKVSTADKWVNKMGAIGALVPKHTLVRLNTKPTLSHETLGVLTLGILKNRLASIKNNGNSDPVAQKIARPTITNNEGPNYYLHLEPSTIAEPFATRTLVFITGIGLPEKQTNKLLIDAFETCLPKTVLVVPTYTLSRFLLAGNKIPHATRWSCRTKGSLQVFVPKKLVASKTGATLDESLGLCWSNLKPFENFAEQPKEQEKMDDQLFEKLVFSDFSNRYTKDDNYLFLHAYSDKKWVLYVIGGGASDGETGLIFDDSIGWTSVCINLALCFWETTADLDTIKKKFHSSYSLVVSGLLASGLEQKIDFTKFFGPLVEPTINTKIGYKNFMVFDKIMLNIYHSFHDWDNYKIAPRIRLRKKNSTEPFINFEPFVDPTAPDHFFIKQGNIHPIQPPHGMIIFNCKKDYKGCILDVFEAAIKTTPNTNLIIVVRRTLVQQYIKERGDLPNADAWLCRYLADMAVYVPKTKLTLAYGDKIASKNEIKEIDAILGIKWSSLEPIKSSNNTGIWSSFLGYLAVLTDFDDNPKCVAKHLEQLFVTVKEYDKYNQSNTPVKPVLFFVLFNGHGSAGETVDMAIEKSLEEPIPTKKIEQLGLYKKEGRIFMPGKIGHIADFDNGLIELLTFFNEQCSVGLVFIDTCYGWYKKFEQLDKKKLQYWLITNNLVNTTSHGRGTSSNYAAFLTTLQKSCSIPLAKLLSNIYPIKPNEGMLPHVRRPGDQISLPLKTKYDKIFMISTKTGPNQIKVPTSRRFCSKATLLESTSILGTILYPDRSIVRPFISLLPGTAIHTLAKIDAPDTRLQDIIRAFASFELKENKVFVVDKISAQGTLEKLNSKENSLVKLTVVNSSGTDEYDKPTVRILVENLDTTNPGPLGGYAKYHGYIKDNITLNVCNTKEELEKEKVRITKEVNKIKYIRDFAISPNNKDLS